MSLDFKIDWASGNDEESIPKALELEIDKALAMDFTEVCPISPEDKNNDMYKAVKFTLDSHRVKILYERKVITLNKEPIIPRVQFILGFRPTDGLCFLTTKEDHKVNLCDSPIRELAKQCFLTQSLMYILVETGAFKVWSYVPVCCGSNDSCPNKTRPLEIRKTLFRPDPNCHD